MQEQFLALKASAGSGKTFNLSLRFIYLLFQGANPHQILTLTFTKKASIEMHHRIYEHLKSLLQSFEQGTFESNDIYKALLQKGLSAKHISENIADVYANFIQSNPRIATIDSFFYSVLKKFCWYVGVSLKFDVGERNKNEIYEMFLGALSHKEIQEIARFCFAQGLSLEGFLSMLDKFSFLPNDVLKNSCSTKQNAKHLNLEQIAQKISENMAKIRDELIRQNVAPRAIKLFDKTFDDLMQTKEVNMLAQWSEHNYLTKSDLSSMDYVRDEIYELFAMYYSQKQGQILTQILHYLARYQQAQHKVMQRDNVLDFDTIGMKNYELLAQNIDRDFFYFRLDERITHILLDEFQDTSCMQYQILQPIIEEILAGNGRIGDRSVFMVGDEKQSIYMFRGSYAGIFEEATKNLTQENLGYNYRSSKRVIDFNNEVFSQCFEQYINQQYPFAPTHNDGFVRIIESVPSQDNKYTKKSIKEETAEHRQSLITQVYNELETLLQRGASEDEIAILVFDNKDILSLKEYIQAQMPKLNIVTETNSQLLEKKEVKILLNALKYIALDSKVQTQEYAQSAENEESYFKMKGALKLYEKNISKLLGESYSHSVMDTIKSLRICIDTPPSKAILSLIEALELAQSVSWRFLEISCEYRSIEEFLQDLPTMLCQAPTQSNYGVKIMTIHKSKGLEFEYVILCDKLGGENHSKDKFITEYDKIHIKGLYYKMKHREVFDEAYKQALQTHTLHTNQEKRNVLYVAFTRAKYGLSVLMKPKGKFDILNLPHRLDEISLLPKAHKEQTLQNCQYLLHTMPKLGEQEDFIRVEQSREVLDIQSWRNIIFGSALHSVFELYLGYKMAIEDIQSILFNRYGFVLSLENIEQSIQKAVDCTQNVVFKKLLGAKHIACEVSYMTDNYLYRMDTLLYDKQEWIVLDYKSAAGDVDSQKQQVRGYMEFLKQKYLAKKEYETMKEYKTIRGFVVYPLNKQDEQFEEVLFDEVEV